MWRWKRVGCGKSRNGGPPEWLPVMLVFNIQYVSTIKIKPKQIIFLAVIVRQKHNQCRFWRMGILGHFYLVYHGLGTEVLYPHDPPIVVYFVQGNHPLKCVQCVVLLGGTLGRMFDGSPHFLFVFYRPERREKQDGVLNLQTNIVKFYFFINAQVFQ